MMRQVWQLWTSRSFPLLLVNALAMIRLQGALPTDPNNHSAPPQRQLEAARWQAEQSEIERRSVGQRRHERQVSYKADLVAGLQSERRKREEMIYPTADTQTFSKSDLSERNRRLFLKLDGLFISVLSCWWIYRNSRAAMEFASTRLRKIFFAPKFYQPVVKDSDLAKDTDEFLIPAPVSKQPSFANRSEPRRRSENIPPPLVVVLKDRQTGLRSTCTSFAVATADPNRLTNLKDENDSETGGKSEAIRPQSPQGLAAKPQAQNREARTELPSAKLARAFFTTTRIHLELLQTQLEALRADPPPPWRDQLMGEIFASLHAIHQKPASLVLTPLFGWGVASKRCSRK